MKKIIILIIALLLFIPLLIVGIVLTVRTLSPHDKNMIVLKDNVYEINVYDEIYLSKLVGKDISEDFLIDTNSLGKKEISYETKSGKNKKVTINIVDKEPPTIMIGNNYNHIHGTKLTIYDDIFCGDNYDKEVKCEIVGDYDIETLGTYKVKYVAVDSSGNKTEKNINFNVVEKPKKDYTLMPFEEVKKRVGDNKLLIDVSKWEENINWKKVKESGIDYAFIRLGTQKHNTKEMVLDAYFEKNYKEAIKNDIKVGVYFFTYAKDKEEILEHADYVLNHLKGKNIELGVALDWECWEEFNSKNISIRDLNEMGKAFLDKVEEAGYKPVLYSSKNYLENVWNIDTNIWLAHYTEKTNYQGEKLIWQFASNGSVPGISSDVDVNVYYGE